MSNYQPLWEYVVKAEKFPLKMTFKEIEILLGIPLNRAFLSEKKQLLKIGISDLMNFFHILSKRTIVHSQPRDIIPFGSPGSF